MLRRTHGSHASRLILLFITANGILHAVTGQTVTIGKQTWTAKNLEVSTYRNGVTIPQVQNPAEWKKLTTGAWCYCENNVANGATCGKLYNWYALTDPRGLAPAGFHIPNDSDWIVLENFLGAGDSSIFKGYGLPFNPSLGFKALACGFRNAGGVFQELDLSGYWWSATDILMMKLPAGKRTDGAWVRIIYLGGKEIPAMNNQYYSKRCGVSIRCVKD